MITINPNSPTPIYRQIIDQVKMQVITGQLAPGDRLESVSSLAARLKVNPMTISKAFSALVDEGIARRRRGVGIFIAPRDPEQVDKDRQRVLTEALSRAAALVVRLGIAPRRALDLFQHQIDNVAAKNRSSKP